VEVARAQYVAAEAWVGRMAAVDGAERTAAAGTAYLNSRRRLGLLVWWVVEALWAVFQAQPKFS
jgi:hypothetical protein